MKVIRVSNYDHEDSRGDQWVVAGPGLSRDEADAVCARLCKDPKRSDEDYYRSVPDNHELYKFEP